MNIQQNLNALLAMGAVGARTSGAYQKRTELNKLNTAQKGLQNYNKELLKDYNKDQTEATLNLIGDTGQQLSQIAQEKAKLNPKYAGEAIAIEQTQNTLYEDMKNVYQQKKGIAEQEALTQQQGYIDQVISQRDAFKERMEMLQSKVDRAKATIEGYKIGKGGKK